MKVQNEKHKTIYTCLHEFGKFKKQHKKKKPNKQKLKSNKTKTDMLKYI